MRIENSSPNLVISNTYARQIILALESFADGLLWREMTRSYASTWRLVANGFMCGITKGKNYYCTKRSCQMAERLTL